MTAHTCREYDPTCYRCELSRDEVRMAEREELAAPIKDAFYEARDQGRTMHQAADDAAGRILSSDWLAERLAGVWDEAREAVRAMHPRCTDGCDLCIVRNEVLDDLSANPYREGEA